MPNFHTHWLVALQTIDGLPRSYDYLRKGRQRYVVSARKLGATVRAHVSEILKALDLDGAADLQKTIGKRVEEYEKTLRSDPDAICFSAFMLGACGPDFWVLPVDTTGGMIPDVASHHFDLGHYNRTHLQFEVSLEALGRSDDLQARVEKAYFLGMATHIGADLVLHELVNVSAGAYNLLKMDVVPPNGTWSNEQGMELLSPDAAAPPQPAPEGNWFQRGVGHVSNAAKGAAHHAGENSGKLLGDAVPLWTTHNKVEHYWDTWVRHRWLGDFGKRVWTDDVDLSPAFEPLRLPLCDTIRLDLLGLVGPVAGMGTAVAHYARDAYRKLGRLLPGDDTENERATVYDRVNYVLGSVETRWLLEKPLAFPWLFADAVLRGTCRPFVYSRVVDKVAGAYPETLVFDKAKEEAESAQMDEPARGTPSSKKKGTAPAPQGAGRSEMRKLQFFSTERNTAIPASSWNYLNYITCPALDRLQKHGRDAFYDRKAFPPFVAAGASAARAFAKDLADAYASGHRHLPRLGQFWNLDTGLGLQVQSLKSPERHQVVTRIDWIHVLGPGGIAQALAYEQGERPAYAASMEKAPQPYAPIDAWKDDAARAFTVYRGKKVRALEAIEEDPAVVKDRKYLDRILVADPEAAVAKAPIFARLAKKKPDAPDDQLEEALFAEDSPVAAAAKARVPTGKNVELRIPAVSHRLDLVIRASIARLGAGPGAVAMYLLGDKGDDDVHPPADDDAVKEEYAVEWLRKRSKILDRVVEPEASKTSEHSKLATFNTRLIVNLSADKTKVDARVVKPTKQGGRALRWNNVVPWELHRGHYGRNFAVATARTFTLRGKNRKPPYDFDPTSNFTCLEELGLTEHCFFTLYPLVKLADGRWIDAFSKEPVASAAFRRIKKVSAINFVKIVLLYVIDGGGALQLRWCWQDGVRRRVPELHA